MHAPIRISPHNPDIVYHASQHVHRSNNRGQSWQIISPDLTRNDKSKQKSSGGPIEQDNVGTEMYDTIKAFEESPHQAGLLWVGTDDGLVHLSRDGGAHWQNITPKNMPEWATVNMIELSAHDAGRAFLAVYRYALDDFGPYIFRTDDYGANWTLITGDNGIPRGHFVRVVREDAGRRGLLYAGTEHGMYISFEDGKRWQSFQLNLPVVSIADMVFKDDDLVIATYGRSFWILDDTTPLRQLDESSTGAKAFLYKPKVAYRTFGARIHFNLGEVPAAAVRIEFKDAAGNTIRTFVGQSSPASGTTSAVSGSTPGFVVPHATDEEFPVKKGMNQFEWDLRYAPAEVVSDAFWFGDNFGPLALPGTYTVTLTVGDWSQSEAFELKSDPRVRATLADYRAQFDLAIQIRDKITKIYDGVRLIRSLRDQLDKQATGSAGAAGGGLLKRAEVLRSKLTVVENTLMQTKNEDPLDTTNFPPQIDAHYVRLLNVVLSADARPTDGSYERMADLDREMKRHLDELQMVVNTDVAAYNKEAAARRLPPLALGVEK